MLGVKASYKISDRVRWNRTLIVGRYREPFALTDLPGPTQFRMKDAIINSFGWHTASGMTYLSCYNIFGEDVPEWLR